MGETVTWVTRPLKSPKPINMPIRQGSLPIFPDTFLPQLFSAVSRMSTCPHLFSSVHLALYIVKHLSRQLSLCSTASLVLLVAIAHDLRQLGAIATSGHSALRSSCNTRPWASPFFLRSCVFGSPLPRTHSLLPSQLYMPGSLRLSAFPSANS